MTSTTSQIHPSAVIAAGAAIGSGVSIGPHVVIEDDVVVGDETTLLAGTVLLAGSRVGARCSLGPYAVVGGKPMDQHFHGEPSLAVLEDEVELREFVTVHRATGEGAETRVGKGALVMSYAHISHNCCVGHGATLVTSVQLGGHSQVGEYAVLGSAALVHQYGRIGAYAMLGAASAANMDVLPYTLARGNTVRHYRLNRVGLHRHGIDGERYRKLELAFRALRRRDLSTVEALAAESAEVQQMLAFRHGSTRGVARFVGK